MQIPQKYQEHVAFMKKFNEASSIGPERDDKTVTRFEEIYTAAKDIAYGEAKEYLENMDEKDLRVLQHYHSLADTINVDSLDEEGAINLLAHRYENLDYNNDGIVKVGIGSMMAMIPQNMPMAEKERIYDTFEIMRSEGMSEKEEFEMMAMIGFQLNKDNLLARLSEETGIPYQSSTQDYYNGGYIEAMKEHIYNPKAGESTSEELKNLFLKFFDAYERAGEEKYDLKSALQTVA